MQGGTMKVLIVFGMCDDSSAQNTGPETGGEEQG
jgi:hypothetical protein